MPTLEQISNRWNSSELTARLSRLYSPKEAVIHAQTLRYQNLLERFKRTFPDQPQASFFSAPGRTEVGGNHTDHNAGRVLAAAVDLDILAAVAPRTDGLIHMHSEGYPPDTVDTAELGMLPEEKNTAAALIRGVCARLSQQGYQVGGFDAVATSTVPKGSGLSSSAAYEVLVATILNHLYNQGAIDPVLIAQIGQYAENQFFGKPCGLMDQTTSAVGGFVTIDFADFSQPVVKKVDFDFAGSGYTLVIVDTWGDHANLTEDYAAIKNEMMSVARLLGNPVLRPFSEEKVLNDIPRLRSQVSDRAILRAVHFFRDNQRVVEQVQALESKDFKRFLELVNESGRSSWMLNQNCYTCHSVEQQGIPVALTLSESVLGRRGAWRVHGGGFAGTIQAFVPDDLLEKYVATLEAACGAGACHCVQVRPEGATKVI